MVTSVGNSSLSLSWTNGFDGFSPLSNVVISYEVDRYPQEGTQAQTFLMGTSATLVGLHPYSNYTLHVSLTNAVGFISNPTNITVTTLSLRPIAPAITSVVAMSSIQVTIMWTPSINSSNTAPVTSWTVLYSCYSPWNPSSCPFGSITSSSTSSSITGLVKGSSYTFVVFGVNSRGVGDVSLPATNQTLVDPPMAVVGLLATKMTTTSVNLIWTPPTDNGGQNISHYVIQYGILDGNNLINITNTTTMATQILLSGLTENSWYLFSVAAHNGFAVGDVSLKVTLLLGYPIKPASVLPSVITDTYVNITWLLENPAGFIDYFILSYRLESSQTWNVAAPILSNGTLNYLLTGLSPNTTYVVGVATKNGLQDPSNYTTVTFTTAVPLDPPSNVMVTSVGNSSLSLSWTNGFDGFSPFSNVVISYEVDRYPQEGTQAQTFPMGTSATLVGLHPYSNYTLHVRLVNAAGVISRPANITVPTVSLTSIINSTTTAPVTSWTVLYTCSSPWNVTCPSVAINSILLLTSKFSIDIMGSCRCTVIVGGVNSGGFGDISSPETIWIILPVIKLNQRLPYLATMKANTVYSLQKRNNASGEIGYTGDQEQDTAMEVNCAYATFRFNENNEIEAF
eukprot:Em0005g9a